MKYKYEQKYLVNEIQKLVDSQFNYKETPFPFSMVDPLTQPTKY